MLLDRARATSWRQLGEQLGFTGAYLHAVANGEKRVSEEVANRLGLTRKEMTWYEEAAR